MTHYHQENKEFNNIQGIHIGINMLYILVALYFVNEPQGILIKLMSMLFLIVKNYLHMLVIVKVVAGATV